MVVRRLGDSPLLFMVEDSSYGLQQNVHALAG